MKDEVLFDNKWVSLKRISNMEDGIHGYIYSHETRCKGKIISILPFRRNGPGQADEYLFRSEITPCWDISEPIVSTITGGVDSNFPREDALRELREESGYRVELKDLIFLGNSYASKSSDTVYSLFSVDLTGREQGEAGGDDSDTEWRGSTIWKTKEQIMRCKDPQASVCFLRLKEHMSEINAHDHFQYSTGLVLGKFYPPHEGHKFLIKNAQASCRRVLVVVGTLPSEKISGKTRVEWIKNMIDITRTEVIEIPDNNPDGVTPKEELYWTIWRDSLQKNLPYVPECLFSSERYGPHIASFLGMDSQMVDPDRKMVPISGTMIRENPSKYSHFLSDEVKKHYEKNI